MSEPDTVNFQCLNSCRRKILPSFDRPNFTFFSFQPLNVCPAVGTLTGVESPCLFLLADLNGAISISAVSQSPRTPVASLSVSRVLLCQLGRVATRPGRVSCQRSPAVQSLLSLYLRFFVSRSRTHHGFSLLKAHGEAVVISDPLPAFLSCYFQKKKQ